MTNKVWTRRRQKSKSKPKPNRQRCHEFRERKKIRIQDLEQRVQRLRDEVADLTKRKSLHVSKLLQQRHSAHGSLEQLVRKYFSVFQYGATSINTNSTKIQQDFLSRIMDPMAQIGPEATFAQWCYLTASHASFVGKVQRIEISGSEEDPILRSHMVYKVVLSRKTFQYLYPHALSNEELVQRCIGLTVPCPVIGTFRFSEDGKIISADGDIGLMEGFLNAGCSLNDIAEILGSSILSQGRVPEECIQRTTFETIDVDDYKSDECEPNPSTLERLSMSYLLDDNEEETKNSSEQSTVAYYTF